MPVGGSIVLLPVTQFGKFCRVRTGSAIELVYDECIDLMAVVWRLAGAFLEINAEGLFLE